MITGKICERHRFQTGFIESGLLALALLLTFTILAIRYSRILWGIIPGEIISPAKMLQISAFLLLPFCLVSGALFVLANHFAKHLFHGTPISTLYMAEATGAAVGGLLLHFFLLPNFLVLTIASITGIHLCITGFVIRQINREKIRLTEILSYSITFCLLFLSLFYSSFLDMSSRRWEWPKSHLLASDDSIFSNIVVTTENKQVSFFTNSLWYFSSNDRQSAEEAIHLAMLEHPNPVNVLILGSSFSGVANEALKHPSVESLDLVELDPDIVALSRRFLPPRYLKPFNDPRVTLHITDARNFLRRCPAEAYDVIIMIEPDPVNALISKYYTAEFFSEVRTHLRNQGVFSFRLTGSENMLGTDMATYLTSAYWTARKVFDQVICIPGENTRFICSPQKGRLTADPSKLEDRLLIRHLHLLYVRSDSIQVMFNPFKISYITSLFDELRTMAVLNHDFRPRCYYDDIVVWSKQYGEKLARLLKYTSNLHPGYTFFIFITLFFSLFLLIPRLFGGRSSKESNRICFSTAVVGFSHITIEIILILSFQIFYGFLYRQLGLLVGSFMAGLAAGTWIGDRSPAKNQGSTRSLCWVQCLMLTILVIIYFVLKLSQHHSFIFTTLPDWFLFPFIAALTGIIGGLQFPWASAVLSGEKMKIEKAAGYLYGYDLAGSAAGCIIASIFLIPLYGIPYTLLFLGILGLFTMVILVPNRSISS